MFSRLRRTGKSPQSPRNRHFPFRIAPFQTPISLSQLRIPFLRPRTLPVFATPSSTNPRPSSIPTLHLPPPALSNPNVSLQTPTATVSRVPSEQEEFCTPPAEWIRNNHPDSAYTSHGDDTFISVGSSSWQTLFQDVESGDSDASSYQGADVSSVSLRAVRDADSSELSGEASMPNEGKHEDGEGITANDVELRTEGAVIKAAKIVVNGPIVQEIRGTSVIIEYGNYGVGEHKRTFQHQKE